MKLSRHRARNASMRAFSRKLTVKNGANSTLPTILVGIKLIEEGIVLEIIRPPTDDITTQTHTYTINIQQCLLKRMIK